MVKKIALVIIICFSTNILIKAQEQKIINYNSPLFYPIQTGYVLAGNHNNIIGIHNFDKNLNLINSIESSKVPSEFLNKIPGGYIAKLFNKYYLFNDEGNFVIISKKQIKEGILDNLPIHKPIIASNILMSNNNNVEGSYIKLKNTLTSIRYENSEISIHSPNTYFDCSIEISKGNKKLIFRKLKSEIELNKVPINYQEVNRIELGNGNTILTNKLIAANSNKHYIYTRESKKVNLVKSEVLEYIYCVDSECNLLFKHEIKGDVNRLKFNNLTDDNNGNVYLFGNYETLNEKNIATDKGWYVKKINNNGIIKDSNFLSYNEQIPSQNKNFDEYRYNFHTFRIYNNEISYIVDIDLLKFESGTNVIEDRSAALEDRYDNFYDYSKVFSYNLAKKNMSTSKIDLSLKNDEIYFNEFYNPENNYQPIKKNIPNYKGIVRKAANNEPGEDVFFFKKSSYFFDKIITYKGDNILIYYSPNNTGGQFIKALYLTGENKGKIITVHNFSNEEHFKDSDYFLIYKAQIINNHFLFYYPNKLIDFKSKL